MQRMHTLGLLYERALSAIRLQFHNFTISGRIIRKFSGGPHGERGARAYNGGMGAVPPAGSRGRAPGQGVRGRSPPEAERFLVLLYV